MPELGHVSEDQGPRLPRSTAVPCGLQAFCGTALRYLNTPQFWLHPRAMGTHSPLLATTHAGAVSPRAALLLWLLPLCGSQTPAGIPIAASGLDLL